MLPINSDFVFEHLNNYFIIKFKKKIIAIVFLRVYNKRLAEIRSLAVTKEFQSKGLGRKLINFLKKRAHQQGIKKLFALTLAPGFFEKNNFKITDKKMFPEKIWLDCVNCPKIRCCDEVAMLYKIN